MDSTQSIFWLNDVSLTDIAFVGGKNASLGEMIRGLKPAGIAVPPGFVVSAQMYRDFVHQNHLDELIKHNLSALDEEKQTLLETGAAIREGFLWGEFSAAQSRAIGDAYQRLCDNIGRADCDVAVRSSATAEDLPEASFAGQQESYLNISGTHMLLEACRSCFASLFTDRAIVYRQEQGFSHKQVALSVGVQQMVRADLACAGVMFTLDTESGFPRVVTISAAWGLGETVVKGSVTPDRYRVFKPLLDNSERVPIIEKTVGSKLKKCIYADSHERIYADNNKTDGAESTAIDCTMSTEHSALTSIDPGVSTVTVATTLDEQAAQVLNDHDIMLLARWSMIIEQHYQRPMDIEWAKDGISGELFIVQARPETIESTKDHRVLQRFTLKESAPVLTTGASVGHAITSGQVYYLSDPQQRHMFPTGAILVTQRTDPDWVPVMRRAKGIVTDTGGSTSHAAIVSRELNVPAIVGTGNATAVLAPGSEITLNCADGATGKVHQGILAFDSKDICLADIARTRTHIMINAALPDSAMSWWQLPVDGIGLTRIEFIISGCIRVHPMALLYPDKVKDKTVLEQINALTANVNEKSQYFINQLALGIGAIAATVYPRPAIVRMSDFKSNEYRGLLGGEFFEIDEQNPMLGLRGASRYYHSLYREAFELECYAIKQVREQMGFDNVIVMIPFCRTPQEADKVLEVMAAAGLKRAANGLEVYVMCEIPSNIILAEQFCERFDGFSIGSNDLTQLILGVDRDSSELKALFDPRDEAVKKMIAQVIDVAHKHQRKVGICGQAPSDYPEFTQFLVDCGIDSVSLNPDCVPDAARLISQAENKR